MALLLGLVHVLALRRWAHHCAGSAEAFDHNQIIHEVWTMVFQEGIHLWVERVPSKYNISDSPSRFEHQIMYDIGAQWCRPVLDSVRILPPG